MENNGEKYLAFKKKVDLNTFEGNKFAEVCKIIPFTWNEQNVLKFIFFPK